MVPSGFLAIDSIVLWLPALEGAERRARHVEQDISGRSRISVLSLSRAGRLTSAAETESSISLSTGENVADMAH